MAGAVFGFSLRAEFERPDASLVASFHRVPTGNVGDALGRSAAMHPRIKPVVPGMRLAGVAFTVRSRPVDNLVVWKALELAHAGDVLVIATGDYDGHACWGDLTSRVAVARGLAGVVTDGAVRDVEGMREAGLPVFAAAITPNSPHKDGPGETNIPITCGGQVVHPGDILVGDDDGVVVVPRGDAERALTELRRVQAYERARTAEIAAGGHIPDWVDRLLAERGAQIDNGRG